MSETKRKRCFGKNRCWNQVRRKCLDAVECAQEQKRLVVGKPETKTRERSTRRFIGWDDLSYILYIWKLEAKIKKFKKRWVSEDEHKEQMRISANALADLYKVNKVLEGVLEKVKQPHPILCLVGSTSPNWKERYRQVLVELTLKGYICQTVVWFKDQLENFEIHRKLLESIHFQKVRMSEAVVLIHADAVGKHTKMEMDYAKSLKIPVITF